MSKPSEKAMQLQDGFYLKYCDGTDDGMEGFHYFTVRRGKVLPSLPVDVIERAKTHITRQAISEHKRVLGLAESALADAQAGLDYVRQHHGDLYGVGFDRCEQNSRLALAAIAELKTNEKPNE